MTCDECRCRKSEVLLAVCDVLVIKALETMGKRIVRADRSRFKMLNGTPFHEAHTLWQPDDCEVNKALKNAWDVVPVMVEAYEFCEASSAQVTAMLDSYVHDLVITGTPHSLGELQYRFTDRLGIPVHEQEHGYVNA